MYDFESGPQSFSIYLDSTDNVNSESEDFTVQLPKPLNFSAGTWEVAALQIIFKIKKINSKSIFKVLTDFVVPQICGSKQSQMLALDILPSKAQITSYKYENPTYVQVLGSYISSINIKIVDNLDNKLDIIDDQFPIILKLHFRKL